MTAAAATVAAVAQSALDELSMLARGYFPRELPPVFSTASFANASGSLAGPFPNEWTSPATLNLARPGTLRRRLAIPNPFAQRRLVQLCVANWQTLRPHLSQSPVSLSSPRPRSTGRSLQFRVPWSDLPSVRLARMAGARFTVLADVSAYYRSIYTHSIEWALHTKKHAKANLAARGPRLLGGELDHAIQLGQDGQTKGIPIGPDTSLLISELILSAIDAQMWLTHPRLPNSCLRLMDDLEYYARTRSEAEDVLTAWDGLLSGFDLALNPKKTCILDGIIPSDAPWRVQISQLRIRTSSDRMLANDFHSAFAVALQLSRDNPDDAVLTYALTRLRSSATGPLTWAAFADMLLASSSAEPSSLSVVARSLVAGQTGGRPLELGRIADTMNGICYYHAPLEHGSEVAWSLYVIRELGLTLDASAAARVARMLDNCALLLLLDLISRGSVQSPIPDVSSILARAGDPLARVSEDWLLAYECARTKWCSDVHFQSENRWKELLQAGVAFFPSLGPPPAVTGSAAAAPTVPGPAFVVPPPVPAPTPVPPVPAAPTPGPAAPVPAPTPVPPVPAAPTPGPAAPVPAPTPVPPVPAAPTPGLATPPPAPGPPLSIEPEEFTIGDLYKLLNIDTDEVDENYA